MKNEEKERSQTIASNTNEEKQLNVMWWSQMQLFFSLCVSSLWTAEPNVADAVRQQCDGLTWKNHSVSGEILFAFFLFHTRIEIVLPIAIIIINVYVCVCLQRFIWSTIAFTATVLIVWYVCWLRFLFDDHVFFINFVLNFEISTKNAVYHYLSSFFIHSFIFLLTINLCVVCLFRDQFQFFFGRFSLIADLRLNSFYLTRCVIQMI